MLDHNIKQEPLRGLLGMGGGISQGIGVSLPAVLSDAVTDPYLDLALIYGSTSIQTTGLAAYRYYKYQVHSNQSHFPRSSRLVIRELGAGSVTTITTFTSDNCSDSGTIPGDGTEYTYDFGSTKTVDESALFSTFNGGDVTASMALYGSADNSNWSLLASGRASNNPLGATSINCGAIPHGLTYFSDYSYRIKNSGQGKKAKVSGSGVKWQTTQKKFYTGSVSFDGTSWVDVEGTFLTQSDWTISAWLYKNSSGQMDLLTMNGNSCSINFGSNYVSCDGDGIPRVNFSGGGLSIPTTTWFHFALTKRGSTYYLYIDGVKYSGSFASDIPSGTLSLGNTRAGYNSKWNGYIQEFKIYDGIVKYNDNFTPPGATLGN